MVLYCSVNKPYKGTCIGLCMYFRALSNHLNIPVVIETMKERKGLSLAEEMGILLEKMKRPEKEDFIQSYLYLIREEEPEEVILNALTNRA